MKRGILVTLAVLLIVIALVVLNRRGLPVQAGRVTRGDIYAFVDEPGTTRLKDEVLVTMPYSGRINPIDLEVGDAVQQGEVVAQVSPADVALELEESRAAVARLEGMVEKGEDHSVERLALKQAKLFDQSMTSTVEAAQQQLLASDARRKYAKSQYDRVSSLFRTGAETQDDLDQAKLLLDERDYEYSQNALVLAALRTLKQATGLLPETIEEYIHRRDLDAKVLRRQMQEADVRYQQAKLRADRAVMTSPIDGVILEKAINDAQYLQAGTTLLRLGALDDLEIEADVLSEDAVEIRAGDAVQIYGAGLGRPLGVGVDGRVDRVEPSGFTKISSLGVEQQRVYVVILFNEGVLAALREQIPLGVGYRVRVRIYIDRRKEVPIIPRAALFRGAGGGWQVFVVEGGRAERRGVEVGLMNDDHAEVLSGLAVSDTVVLAPENSLSDGTRVDPLISETRAANTSSRDAPVTREE